MEITESVKTKSTRPQMQETVKIGNAQVRK